MTKLSELYFDRTAVEDRFDVEVECIEGDFYVRLGEYEKLVGYIKELEKKLGKNG